MLLVEGEFSGDLRFDNVPIKSISEKAKAEIRKTRFGFLTQSSFLIPSMTCAENVALPLLINGQSMRSALRIVNDLTCEADEVCGVTADQGNLCLSQKLQKYPSEISGGQRKRLALLRSLVHSPEILFADEPFSNLDAITRSSIVVLLQKWKDGELLRCEHLSKNDRTVIVVSHEDDLRNCASKLVTFSEGGSAIQKLRRNRE
jgi:putative ABC transport system ATP-binding protein